MAAITYAELVELKRKSSLNDLEFLRDALWADGEVVVPDHPAFGEPAPVNPEDDGDGA